jgi:hypothetical protein
MTDDPGACVAGLPLTQCSTTVAASAVPPSEAGTRAGDPVSGNAVVLVAERIWLLSRIAGQRTDRS